MATQVIKMRIQIRRDTTENWLLYKDVIPAAGEPCFDLNLKTLKIGDGVTTYENLEAINGVDIGVDGRSLVLDDGVLKLIGFDDAEIGAQPIKGQDGNIEWIKPSTEAVDSLRETVDNLQSSVTGIQTIVDDIMEVVIPSEEGSATLLERVESLETKVDSADTKFLTKLEANASFEKIKYEITNTPVGTLIDYRENEIRVMVPSDAEFVKQSVGVTGNPNMYYMGFKVYAPDGAVSFKEGDRGVIIDEMFTFDDDFAGTDKYGRNYSICWLALASYSESSDTWTYFGKNSSFEKYIGWDYVVEWYNADGIVIAYDCVRINLSNENCHYSTKPYYVENMIKEIDNKIEEKIVEVSSAYEVTEF